MNLHDPQRVSTAGRLDRLPIFSFHRRMMWLLSFCFFFELAGINTFAYAAPAIRAQWGISIATVSLITSGTFFGMFLGAATGGWFADRIGRKRGLILSVGWFSAFSLLNAFAWEPVGLFFARLMTGIGLAAMTAIAITYIAEMYPAQRRGSYQGWIMAIGLCGIPVAALVSRIVVPAFTFGWRLVFVWGALALLFPFAARKLEESPRWYEKRGQFAEADAILERIERAAESETALPLPPPPPLNSVARTGSYSELFAPHIRSRTAMLVTAWIFQTLGFYGFSAFAPLLLVEHGFKLVESLQWVTLMQLAGVPGAFIAGFVSDKWQRKYWIILFAILIATCGMLYGLTFQAVFIVMFGGLMTMCIQSFAPLLYAYTAECFPTEVRSTGTGFAYGIGRLANAAGPLVIAQLYATYGYSTVFAYIAGCWLVVAGVVAMGPMTRGRTL